MKDLNRILIEAKNKKSFSDIIEFKCFIKKIMQIDKDIILDWDTGAGEEWARLTKNEVGVICMLNCKIGIVFARQNCLDKEIQEILNTFFVVDVKDYNLEEWCIDLSALAENTPEISWNVSPYAIDTEKMSLNDLYFATV